MDLNFLRKQSFNKGKSSSHISSNLILKEQQKQMRLVKNFEKTIESFNKIDVNSLEKEKGSKINQKVQTPIRSQIQNVNKAYIKNNKKFQFENESKITSISMNQIEGEKQNKIKINENNQVQDDKKKNRSSINYKINLNLHQQSKENDSKPLSKIMKEKEVQNQELVRLKGKLKARQVQLQKIKKEINEKENIISRLNNQYQSQKDTSQKEKQYLKSELKILTRQVQHYKKILKQPERSLEDISIKKIQLFGEKNRITMSRNNINFNKRQYRLQNQKQVELQALNEKLTSDLRIWEQRLKDKQEEQKMVTSENIYLKQHYEVLQKENNIKIEQMNIKINKLDEQNSTLKLKIDQNEELFQRTKADFKIQLDLINKMYNQCKQNYQKSKLDWLAIQNQQKSKISFLQLNIKEKDQKIKIQTNFINQFEEKQKKIQQQMNHLKKQKIQYSNQLINYKNQLVNLRVELAFKINKIQGFNQQKHELQKHIDQTRRQNLDFKNQIIQLKKIKDKSEQDFKKIESTLNQQIQIHKQQILKLTDIKMQSKIQLKNKEDQIKEIKKLEILRTQELQEKFSNKFNEFLSEIRRLEQELEKSYYQKQDLENQYDHLYKSFSDQQQAYDKLSQQQDKNLEKLEMLNVELTKKENHIQSLSMQLEESQQAKNLLSKKMDSSQCEFCNQLTKELNKITTQFQTFKYQYTEKLERFKQQNQELKNLLRVSTISGILPIDMVSQ